MIEPAVDDTRGVRPLLRPGVYEVWHQWRRVEYGRACVEHLSGELARLGVRRPFLLSNRSLEKEGGVLGRVRAVVGDDLVGAFAECDAHVPHETVLRAAAQVRASDADGLVTLGGSSVIDTGKAVTMAVAEGLERPEEFQDYAIRRDGAGGTEAHSLAGLPLQHIALPTTLSGGEFTAVVAMTDSLKVKHLYADDRLAPGSVLLDPALTAATPDRLWASTAVKTLSDAIEQLYSRASTPVTDALAVRAIEWFFEFLPASLDGDRDARLRCQVASWMALFGLYNARAMVGLGAGLRHQVAARYGVPHGEATCVLLPHVMRFNLPSVLSLQEQLADAVGIVASEDPEETGERVIEHLQRLVSSLGLPRRLGEFGARETDFAEMAEHVMHDHVARTNPREPASADELVSILMAAR